MEKKEQEEENIVETKGCIFAVLRTWCTGSNSLKQNRNEKNFVECSDASRSIVAVRAAEQGC